VVTTISEEHTTSIYPEDGVGNHQNKIQKIKIHKRFLFTSFIVFSFAKFVGTQLKREKDQAETVDQQMYCK
jgi:hypothetical protein